MPRPLPVPVRQALWRRLQAGQDVPTITAALDLQPRTVRRLARRFRRAGQAAVAPSYDACGASTPKPAESLVRAAVDLRREHPTWGAGLIRVMWHRRLPDRSLPTVRTLQRWLERAGLGPAPPGRRPAAANPRARQPHAVWQMDAAELVKLRTKQLVSWLRIVDECSGAVLWTAVFPQGRWNQVPPRETQAQLRLAFARWGRPGRLRVDNGSPWGTRGDLPTDLELWLLGLEVGVAANPPRRPQDNGVVERSQGTAKRWGEPWSCDSPGELQRRLWEMDEIQRQDYPSIAGRSRGEAFPQLAHSGRAYTPEWEEAHWSLERVVAELAGYAVRRRVDATGTISLYNRRHYIGSIHKRKDVFVMFDPGTYEWLVADDEGRQLSRQPAKQINREDIRGLAVSLRDQRTQGQ